MAMTDEEPLESDAAITACPQPRRAVLLPDNPGEHARSLTSSPHSTVEDQAREELRELMGGFGEEDARSNPACCRSTDLSKDTFTKDTFQQNGRSLSSMSTCAGASPILDNWPSTVPSTPQFPRLDEVGKELEDDEKENSGNNYGGNSKSGSRHKIFVGGIPQDLDQDEVKLIMNQFAPVKKAWLQKHKESGPAANNTQRHRGFGFVIFNDAASVDLLLGDKSSRYLALPDGRRIEVKRAVSSADMQKSVEDAGNGPRQPQQPGPKQSPPLWNGGQRQQQGRPGTPGNAQPRLLDPRQTPPHGGFRTPDYNSSNSSSSALLGTPPRMPPMQQGRLTPIPPPPPSPWNQSSQTPPPMMAAVPMMGGSVMVMPRAPGPTNQASLPVGPTMASMQCSNMPLRPQQPPPQVAQPQWNNNAVCNIPWAMELVPGSQSVPCPGGPPTGWAAQWEVAMAAAQRQQMMQVQPQQRGPASQQQLALPLSSTPPMHQQSPQQKSRELDLIREDHPLQLMSHPHPLHISVHTQQQQLPISDAQQPQASSQHGQVQAPSRSQTPGSPQHWCQWQIEEALRQAMPDHYDE